MLITITARFSERSSDSECNQSRVTLENNGITRLLMHIHTHTESKITGIILAGKLWEKTLLKVLMAKHAFLDL